MTPEKLESTLKELGWSHEEFARNINIPENEISEWLKEGTPKLVDSWFEVAFLFRKVMEMTDYGS